MAILLLTTEFIGEGHIDPRVVRLLCDDTSLDVITAAGYVNSYYYYPSVRLEPTDAVVVSSTKIGYVGSFTATIGNNGVVTLSIGTSEIVLPVVSGNIAVFAGTEGAIKDSGNVSAQIGADVELTVENTDNTDPASHAYWWTLAGGASGGDSFTRYGVVGAGSYAWGIDNSDSDKMKLVRYTGQDVTPSTNAAGSSTLISMTTAGVMITGGNIQAGSSGVAGTLTSFPSTASKGSFVFSGTANTGDTVTTLTNQAMGQATVITIPDPIASSANVILSSPGVSGTQTMSGSLTITNNFIASQGFIQAGSSGNAGTVSSFSATGSKGSLKLAAVANTGNTVTTISNAAMGQASVISIPDPATATANFAVAPAALVSGNLVKASGTAGLVADAGARLIANTTSTYGGGGTSNTFAATGLTVGAKGAAVIRASTNSVSITKALPGTDTLAITFSADPGAATTVDYIYATASQA